MEERIKKLNLIFPELNLTNQDYIIAIADALKFAQEKKLKRRCKQQIRFVDFKSTNLKTNKERSK